MHINSTNKNIILSDLNFDQLLLLILFLSNKYVYKTNKRNVCSQMRQIIIYPW